MHVLLICDAYPPEVRSASQLTYDFACGLRDRGHRVTVVAPHPRYNLPEGVRPEEYGDDVVENGIRVLRVRTLPVKKVSWVRRGFGELLMPAAFVRAALDGIREPVDVIEAYSPPLPLAIAGWWLKHAFRCPLVVNVQDLFPQNAVDLGLVQSPAVLAGLRALEQAAYAAADAITVHSDGNGAFLVANRWQPREKVTTIPNWVESGSFAATGAAPPGRFRRKYGVEGQFVLLFGGVIGPAQGLECFVEAMWLLRRERDITLLLVGDGTEKAGLQALCESRGQTNVRFEGFVSKEDYPELVGEADVGVVSITPRYRTPVVPMKLLGYMAGGIATLAALNPESDGHNILADSGAGISVSSADVRGIADAILLLRGDAAGRASMGERGRRYASARFDRGVCVTKYEQLFRRLLTEQ